VDGPVKDESTECFACASGVVLEACLDVEHPSDDLVGTDGSTFASW
jgi:hypothetical protein